MTERDAAPDCILVVRLSALGDVIHTLPAVAALRAALPRCRIGWVVEPPYRELIELVAPVDEVFTIGVKRWRRQSVSTTWREIQELRGAMREFARGAVAIDFQGLIKSAAIAWSSGARLRYGFERAAIRESWALMFLNRTISVDRTHHVVDWNLDLARGIVPSIGAAPPVDLSPFAARPSGTPASLSGRIVLLPGAGRASKIWPAARFRDCARAIEARSGKLPVIAWGPGEYELAESIAAGGCAEIAPPTGLRELTWLLRESQLVIAGDTGPLHLAAALGTKVVALFGPTSPERNGPYGQRHHVVESFSTTRTMEGIAVEQVMKKFDEVWSE
ncbi:MAG TPA: lipopolysaccharide heptosyltransferase I [Thermoanaerobaculia bacterium]|nr:lipopolysaccharide heptosyltransferase I [Thermoanaerobaculia bacterium]